MEVKREITEVLKKHGIIRDNESGQVVIDMLRGQVMKVRKPDFDILAKLNK